MVPGFLRSRDPAVIVLAKDKHYRIDVAELTVATDLTERQAVHRLAELMRTEAPSRRLTLWGDPGVYLEWVSYRSGQWKRIRAPEGKVHCPQRLLDRVSRHWNPKLHRLMNVPLPGRGSPPKPPRPRCTDCGQLSIRWWRGVPVCALHYRLRREVCAA